MRSEVEVPCHRWNDREEAHLVGLQVERSLVQVAFIAEVDEIRVHSIVNVVEAKGPTRFRANVAVFFLFRAFLFGLIRGQRSTDVRAVIRLSLIHI